MVALRVQLNKLRYPLLGQKESQYIHIPANLLIGSKEYQYHHHLNRRGLRPPINLSVNKITNRPHQFYLLLLPLLLRMQWGLLPRSNKMDVHPQLLVLPICSQSIHPLLKRKMTMRLLPHLQRKKMHLFHL